MERQAERSPLCEDSCPSRRVTVSPPNQPSCVRAIFRETRGKCSCRRSRGQQRGAHGNPGSSPCSSIDGKCPMVAWEGVDLFFLLILCNKFDSKRGVGFPPPKAPSEEKSCKAFAKDLGSPAESEAQVWVHAQKSPPISSWVTFFKKGGQECRARGPMKRRTAPPGVSR